MAKWRKGESGNPNGRPEGAVSEKTKQWEVFSEYCLTGGLKKFKDELETLHGKDYVTAFTNLLEFHAPKLARSENINSGEMIVKVIERTIIEKK